MKELSILGLLSLIGTIVGGAIMAAPAYGDPPTPNQAPKASISPLQAVDMIMTAAAGGKNWKVAAASDVGPKGELEKSGGNVTNVCGMQYTVGNVADDGVRIPIEAHIGLGNVSDATPYVYVLYLRLTDSGGNHVLEAGNARAEINGTVNQELAFIAQYKACPTPGTYKVEADLFAIDPMTGKVALLERADCTFEVIQK
jgi:hypothetical protein